ncbi:uncharacterized protein MONBRDRAFT_30385 [Monosiga brevicollis MX1]|uniref:Oxidoreductase n=1 Tax=Monosiga brevicollis TaxID=81824 RepID=A9VDT8_MONBE|nr:uncharacterized protein MONBRDRAFT_30385 [Monosiga brevicollis MX1]EDQ84317.1 predicted protein [Monosiga brevicollis MX1]|eukprot:XP_001750887.1 hypothetical protein [Monosiga brevicollis MX1]
MASDGQEDADEAMELWLPFGTAAAADEEDQEAEDDLHEGFTAEEYRTTLKVLAVLASDLDRYASRTYKELRTTLRPIVSHDSGRNFAGFSWDEYKSSKHRKQETNFRRMKQRQMDQKLIESRRLRAQRLDALQRIQDQARQHELEHVAVPDGPALSYSEQLALTEASDPPAEETCSLEHILRSCYICKARYQELHHFYDQLCPACAALNWEKRHLKADMSGRISLVTGGRIKIGYQIVLKLLRAGSHVIVTTRFPQNCFQRLEQEPDSAAWLDRVQIYGLDLRNLAAVESFCTWMREHHEWLDVIINNACQTIRRPPAYYRHLLQDEVSPAALPPQVCQNNVMISDMLAQLQLGPAPEPPTPEPPTATSAAPARLDAASLPHSALAALSTQIPMTLEDYDDNVEHFPTGLTDVHAQQIDLRTKTSWVMKLEEVSTPEAAEVMAVNALSPFVLNGKLRPLMVRSPHADRYIVNVSAMEGKFYRFKTPNHPHTNMAKAALNMMTRTSAADYAQAGIYMNAVDTGWINDENPLDKAVRIAEEHNFQTPIDEVDAAARVVHPVFAGVGSGEQLQGLFLKDYVETAW